jgi:hypothetical protein
VVFGLDAAGIGHLARDSEGSIRERLNARARSRESGAATRVLPLTGAVVARHDLFDSGVLINPQSGSERKTSLERGSLMAQGRERTKEQLYREAKRLGVKGRSKMNKGQLKAAVERRR